MKKLITVLICLFYNLCFSQFNDIVFSIKQIDAMKLELLITNKSSKNKTLFMDLSNLRITSDKDFGNDYEMFLSNTMVYKERKNYSIPFSRMIFSEHDCYSYSQTGAMEINTYINSNIVEIGGKEILKIVYDISKQENVNFSKNKNREEKEIDVYVIYNGKKIREGLKKNSCFSNEHDLNDFSFPTIKSNILRFRVFVNKVVAPEPI